MVRARATVTELETGESMTATGAVGLDWCAAVTTVRSSEPTTTRRTTAVRDQLEEMTDINSHPQTGDPGQPGGAWLLELSGGNRSAGNSSVVSLTAGWAPGTPRRDTQTLNVLRRSGNLIPPYLPTHINFYQLFLSSPFPFPFHLSPFSDNIAHRPYHNFNFE